MFQLLLLSTLEGSHTLEHLVPVNQGTVELRTVDADELRLATDGQTTGTTHARAIHHDGIQRNLTRDVVFLSSQVRELHHDRGTDGKYLVDMRLLLDEFLNTHSHYALLAIAAVIRHDDDLVRRLTYFIL